MNSEERESVRAACERALVDAVCVLDGKTDSRVGASRVQATVRRRDASRIVIEVRSEEGAPVRRELRFRDADEEQERLRAIGLTIGILGQDLLTDPAPREPAPAPLVPDSPQVQTVTWWASLGLSGNLDLTWAQPAGSADLQSGFSLLSGWGVYGRLSGGLTPRTSEGLMLSRGSATGGLSYMIPRRGVRAFAGAELGAEWFHVRVVNGQRGAAHWSGKSRVELGALFPLSEHWFVTGSAGSDFVFSPANVIVDGNEERRTGIFRPLLRFALGWRG